MGFNLEVKISGKCDVKNNLITKEFLSKYFTSDCYDLELRMAAKWGGPLSLRLSKHELISGDISTNKTKKVVCFSFDSEYTVNWQGSKFKKSDFTKSTEIFLYKIIGTRKYESKFGDTTYQDEIYIDVVKSEILNISIK